MGTGKVRALTAQFLCAGVHLPHKVQHAAAHIPRNDAGRVVGAGDEHGVEQVDAAHRLADAQTHGGAIGILDVLELLRHSGGHGHFAVQVLAAFQQEQGRHELGQACHILLLVGVLAEDGLTGVCVEQIDRFSLTGRLDGHGVGGQTRQRCRNSQRQCQHQCRSAAEKGVLKHERTPCLNVPVNTGIRFYFHFKEYHKSAKSEREKGGF